MNKTEIIAILEDLIEKNPNLNITPYIEYVNSITDNQLQRKTIGFSRKSLIDYIKQKAEREQQQNNTKFNITLNEYFEYGINGSTAHIHLPKDLHSEFQKLGKSKAIAQVGVYLIDAVNKMNSFKPRSKNGLKDCEKIYMISPIFYSGGFYPRQLRRKSTNSITIESPVLTILKRLGLETRTIKAQELQNSSLRAKDSEIQLAYKNFGDKKDVGVASISFETLNSKKWQRRLKTYDRLLKKYISSKSNIITAEER